MLYSAECSSPFPDGEVEFVENKTDPPSRAYLKLWELFTLEQKMPRAGARVLDLGSSPGGWTWVLDQLGCEVISVDKAPLAAATKLSSRVKFIEESAFALKPEVIGKVDWLFSDVICYPERLLELVRRWMASGLVENFVCTVKFQDPTNHAIAAEFLKITGSSIRHLHNNKHELTWTV
jgi:23S rRNA (cytidine2498-2'-O)-methyltransferase